MQKTITRWHWVLACAALLLLTSGCIQNTGSELQPTAFGQGGPTFTPIPTNTIEPLPTYTPFPTVEGIIGQTEDTGTGGVEDIPGITVEETQPDTAQETPLTQFEVEATQIIQNATSTAAAELTATALALGIGNPPIVTATTDFSLPTTPTPTTPFVSGTDCVHEVQAGDNLFRLSLTYGLTINEIAAANGITNIQLIIVGQRLTIPGCGTTGAVPPPTTVPTAAPVPTTTTGTTDTTVPTVPTTGGRTHIVQEGETLFEIAQLYGVTVDAIVQANGIVDPNLILMTTELVIPGG